jgi:hypothetical protein
MSSPGAHTRFRLVSEYVAKVMKQVKARLRLTHSALLKNGEMTQLLLEST